ncbi:MAG: diguanylate cyclase [Deltaproteobacteria bacterium]|nr:diguanylate cyclase [Candidatus Anaeroferrophillacea bacterium]
MEQFYITVARIAKKALNHMVAHHTPLLPDLYAKYFYIFLDEVDQEVKEIIERENSNKRSEIKRQQEGTRALLTTIAEVVDNLDNAASTHDRELAKHQENLASIDRVTDIISLREMVSRELQSVRDSNTSLQHKLTSANEEVRKLETKLAQITDLATIDELTGLFNRRALFNRIVEEHSRAERYQDTFSLLLFDIDDFKLINDTHGHLAGDAVLRKMANFLKGSLRTSDFLGRFGGEEFICVLPSTGLDKARMVGEKLRMLLTKKVFEDSRGEVKIKVTVSIGVSQYHTGDTLDEVIKRADDALYMAKNNGKNVVFTEASLP